MSEDKLFAQRVSLLGSIQIITRIVKIFFVPILTKNLAIEQYGIWVMVGVTISLIPPVIKLGLPEGLVRFLSAEKDKERIGRDFYAVFTVVFLLTAVVSSLFYLFSERVAGSFFGGNILIVYILSILLLLETAEKLLNSIFKIFNKIRLYSFFQIADIFLTFLFVTYFVLAGYGIVGAIMGLLVSVTIVFSGKMLYVISIIGVNKPDFQNLKRYLVFGAPLVPSSISNWLINSSDRYLITLLLGISFAGYYAPGYMLGSLIMIFYAPFMFILTPTVSRHYDENNLLQVEKILKYSTKYFLLFAIPSAFLMSILSLPILSLLSTEEIASFGYLITPYVALSYIFGGLKLIFSKVLIVNNKTKIIGSSVVMAAFLNLGLNLLFIPRFGIIGAAFTTLIAFAINFSVIFFYSRRFIVFDFGLDFILKSVSASAVISILIVYLGPSTVSGLLFSILIGAILYFGIVYALGGLTKEEVKFFRGVVSK